MFNVTLYYSFFIYSSISISISFLDSYICTDLSSFCSIFTSIPSYSYLQHFSFLAFIGDPVKLPSNSSIIFFRSKNHCILMFSILNIQYNYPLYHLDQYTISLKKLNRFFSYYFTSLINPIKNVTMYLEIPIIPIPIVSIYIPFNFIIFLLLFFT